MSSNSVKGLLSHEFDSFVNVWDRLADFEAANTDQALTFLLEVLCLELNAKNAYWLAAVRIGQRDRKDPLYGWRPAATVHLHKPEPLARLVKSKVKALQTGKASESTRNHVKEAGQFRVKTLAEHVSSAYFESEEYQESYVAMGLSDSMWSILPVNQDCESYFCVQRGVGAEPFTTEEKQYMAMLIRGVRWFHRQLMLSYGLLVAEHPITASERRVVKALLSGKSEHDIATKLGWTKATTHGYVTQVFRKFNVRGRAEFAALWLGNK